MCRNVRAFHCSRLESNRVTELGIRADSNFSKVCIKKKKKKTETFSGIHCGSDFAFVVDQISQQRFHLFVYDFSCFLDVWSFRFWSARSPSRPCRSEPCTTESLIGGLNRNCRKCNTGCLKLRPQGYNAIVSGFMYSQRHYCALFVWSAKTRRTNSAGWRREIPPDLFTWA